MVLFGNLLQFGMSHWFRFRQHIFTFARSSLRKWVPSAGIFLRVHQLMQCTVAICGPDCSSLSKWHLSLTGFCKVSADFETRWVIGAAHLSKHESPSGSSSTTCWELTYIWTLDWRSHPRALLGWTLHVDQVLSVSTLTATSCREFSQERQVHLCENALWLYGMGSMGWMQSMELMRRMGWMVLVRII